MAGPNGRKEEEHIAMERDERWVYKTTGISRVDGCAGRIVPILPVNDGPCLKSIFHFGIERCF